MLLKCSAQLSIFKCSPCHVKVQLDSGSSHSFISPKVLSDEQAAIATKSCRRQNSNIQGATGSAKCGCCITKAHLKLGSWAGYHEYVIANPVNKHDVILGRDFLKANDALIDHGNDSITLNGAVIHINAITCIESVPSNIDVYDELDQFAAALQT